MRDLFSAEEEEIIYGHIIGDGNYKYEGGTGAYISDGDGRGGAGWQLAEEVGDAHQLSRPQIIVPVGGGNEGGVERLREIDGVDFQVKHFLPILSGSETIERFW